MHVEKVAKYRSVAELKAEYHILSEYPFENSVVSGHSYSLDNIHNMLEHEHPNSCPRHLVPI